MVHSEKKVLLKLGYTCNNRCIFCHADNFRTYPDSETGDVIKKIKQAYKWGAGMVVLSGGEATIRKDFFVIAEAISAAGLKLGVITNGRMFSYQNFTGCFLRFKPSYVYCSLHGATPELHNMLTKTQSFHQVIGGLKNIAGHVQNLTVNVVVQVENVHRLKEIVKCVIPFAPVRLKFSLVEPKGMALTDFSKHAPEIQEAAQRVYEAMQFGESISNGKQISFCCDGFTPCLIPDFKKYHADLFTDNFIGTAESFERDFSPVDSGDRAYAECCYDCSYKSSCSGIYKQYLSYFENFAVRPQTFPVPNSIPAVAVESNGTKRVFVRRTCADDDFFHDGCALTALEREAVEDTARYLYLKKNGSLKMYKMSTIHFMENEIRNIKIHMEQVYVDPSDGKEQSDFRYKMQKACLHEACRCCARKENCPCVFQPAGCDAYDRPEKKVVEIIKTLKGDVLDVGSGNLLYECILSEHVRCGEIRYVGIDPEEIGSQGSSLTFLKARIEDFKYEDNFFDFILVLRSYNHFHGLRSAFDNIHRLLKPGGKLLVVDNGPFLLIKHLDEPSQNRKKLEHYRNHTSFETLSFLKRYDYRILQHEPIRPAEGNQWMLFLQKQ